MRNMEGMMEGDHDANAGKRRRFTDMPAKNPLQAASSSATGNTDYSLRFLHEFFHFDKSRDRTAVIFDNGKGKLEKLSYQDLDKGSNLVKNLLEQIFHDDDKSDQNFVGVKCDLGILYPIVILGILRCGHAFYNIDQADLDASVEDGVTHLGMKYILNVGNWTGTKSGASTTKTQVEIPITTEGGCDSLSFEVLKIAGKISGRQFFKETLYAYAIQTSGTTGKKKTVLVPHACICGNIEDFSKVHWKLTATDVIFGGAPCTFDPHVVELFSALAVGASILYTGAEVKSNGGLLSNILGYHKVTILQITPSLFRRLAGSISSADSSKALHHLRIIAFGGEKCPGKEELRDAVKRLLNGNIKFQNVYGVTEVSCWASISNIDLSSSEPVTLGMGLLNTEIMLDSDEIVISSPTRYCVIIDPSNNSVVSHQPQPPYQYRTGDMGISTPHGIVFQGRMDRVVKRNGMKVSLTEIEMASVSTGLVSYAECQMHKGKIYLVVKLSSEFGFQEEVSLLPAALSSKLELPLFMYPDYIIAIQRQIPLNGNGKIDFESIIKSIKLSFSSKESIPVQVTSVQIAETLAPVWKSCVNSSTSTRNDGILKENFIASGGTSISASRFVESAFMCLNLFGSQLHQKWEQTLLLQLFDLEAGTFGGIVDTISKIICESSCAIKMDLSRLDEDLLPETQEQLPRHLDMQLSLNSSDFEFQLMQDSVHDDGVHVFSTPEEIPENSDPIILSPPQSTERFQFPLGLCVDASPAVIPANGKAIIGCHGGILLCIDLNVLRLHSKAPRRAITWKRRFPNRMEASVEIHHDSLFAYVGCHDGKFYKLSVSTGEISCWTCCAGTPIRGKCAVSSDLVVFIDSGNSVYCVDSHTLNKIWRVSSFKLLATTSPVIFRRQTILTTLNMGIVSLEIDSGNVLWTICGVDGQSINRIYCSPIIASLKKGNLRKRRATLLLCASNEGIEARDPKSGELNWQHKSSSCRVLQPLINQCCNNLIWIEGITSDSSYLKILSLDTGQLLGCLQISHFGPITPTLLYTKEGCHLMYKSSTMKDGETNNRPLLKFVSLHEILSTSVNGDSAVLCSDVINQCEIGSKNFETFSKSQVWSEFILFGARDNQLHVLKFKA